MLMFDEAISNLGIVEIPLTGNKYTWSNKQENPLLVRLDWFFTSYPGTKAYTPILVPKHILYQGTPQITYYV